MRRLPGAQAERRAHPQFVQRADSLRQLLRTLPAVPAKITTRHRAAAAIAPGEIADIFATSLAEPLAAALCDRFDFRGEEYMLMWKRFFLHAEAPARLSQNPERFRVVCALLLRLWMFDQLMQDSKAVRGRVVYELRAVLTSYMPLMAELDALSPDVSPEDNSYMRRLFQQKPLDPVLVAPLCAHTLPECASRAGELFAAGKASTQFLADVRRAMPVRASDRQDKNNSSSRAGKRRPATAAEEPDELDENYAGASADAQALRCVQCSLLATYPHCAAIRLSASTLLFAYTLMTEPEYARPFDEWLGRKRDNPGLMQIALIEFAMWTLDNCPPVAAAAAEMHQVVRRSNNAGSGDWQIFREATIRQLDRARGFVSQTAQAARKTRGSHAEHYSALLGLIHAEISARKKEGFAKPSKTRTYTQYLPKLAYALRARMHSALIARLRLARDSYLQIQLTRELLRRTTPGTLEEVAQLVYDTVSGDIDEVFRVVERTVVDVAGSVLADLGPHVESIARGDRANFLSTVLSSTAMLSLVPQHLQTHWLLLVRELRERTAPLAAAARRALEAAAARAVTTNRYAQADVHDLVQPIEPGVRYFLDELGRDAAQLHLFSPIWLLLLPVPLDTFRRVFLSYQAYRYPESPPTATRDSIHALVAAFGHAMHPNRDALLCPETGVSYASRRPAQLLLRLPLRAFGQLTLFFVRMANMAAIEIAPLSYEVYEQQLCAIRRHESIAPGCPIPVQTCTLVVCRRCGRVNHRLVSDEDAASAGAAKMGRAGRRARAAADVEEDDDEGDDVDDEPSEEEPDEITLLDEIDAEDATTAAVAPAGSYHYDGCDSEGFRIPLNAVGLEIDADAILRMPLERAMANAEPSLRPGDGGVALRCSQRTARRAAQTLIVSDERVALETPLSRCFSEGEKERNERLCNKAFRRMANELIDSTAIGACNSGQCRVEGMLGAGVKLVRPVRHIVCCTNCGCKFDRSKPARGAFPYPVSDEPGGLMRCPVCLLKQQQQQRIDAEELVPCICCHRMHSAAHRIMFDDGGGRGPLPAFICRADWNEEFAHVAVYDRQTLAIVYVTSWRQRNRGGAGSRAAGLAVQREGAD